MRFIQSTWRGSDETEIHRVGVGCGLWHERTCGGTLDAETERRTVRVFRAALRPRRKAGRKPDRATIRAAELWLRYSRRWRPLLKKHQRHIWQRIYREVIPDFVRLDKLTRQYRTALLRRNVKALLSRRRKRKGRKSRLAIV